MISECLQIITSTANASNKTLFAKTRIQSEARVIIILVDNGLYQEQTASSKISKMHVI